MCADRIASVLLTLPRVFCAWQKLCLTHHTETSPGKEHERPRTIENEMSATEIEANRELVRRLWDSKVNTTEIHKALQSVGKRLGDTGKSKVRGGACC